MFSHLPFESYVIITAFLTGAMIYLSIKYRDRKFRFLLPIFYMSIFAGIITIITKLFEKFAIESTWYHIFLAIQISSTMLLILLITIICIIRCRQGHVAPEKKKLVYFGLVLAIVPVLIIVTLIVIKKLNLL